MIKTNLLEYIPNQMLRITELEKIARVENIEIDGLNSKIDEILNNQFIHSATEIGINRWERILSLVVKKTDTVDERRFRILSLINQSLPYTYKGLLAQLKNIGIEDVLIDLDTEKYVLTVKLRLDLKNKYEIVDTFLRNTVPANLIINILQLFNSYSGLTRFTHNGLSSFTHKHIKEEVLSIESTHSKS